MRGLALVLAACSPPAAERSAPADTGPVPSPAPEAPAVREERFPVDDLGDVDLVWVVDDAPGGADTREAAAAALARALGWADAGWRAYALPAGCDGGLAEVDPEAPGDAVDAAGQGPAVPVRLACALGLALSDSALRSDAALRVVVATPLPDADPGAADAVAAALAALGRPASASAWSTDPGWVALADATGGLAVDPADPLAGDALGRAFAGLPSEFFLSRPAVAETLAVDVATPAGRVVLGADEVVYDPVRNSVRFVDYVAGRGAEVRVRYVAR